MLGECPKPATQSEAVTPTCDECERDGGNHWSHCSHYPGNARAVRFAESRVLAEVRRIIEARPGVRTEAGRTITGAINRRNLLAKLDELREVIVNG